MTTEREFWLDTFDKLFDELTRRGWTYEEIEQLVGFCLSEVLIKKMRREGKVDAA